MNDEASIFIPVHVTYESVSTMMNGKELIDRAEAIMRRYPWIVLTMGAGLGFVASRRRRLS